METSSQTRVYVVDDSAEIRKRIVAVLRESGSADIVGEAETPAAAVDGINTTHPDVVVLDIHLLGGTGMEVLRVSHARFPEIVFVVVTNHPSPQYRKAYLQAGAQHFLDKNTDIPAIATIVANYNNATRH
jgi:two-component system response regulator DevR